jgi:phage terminase small subunit
MEKENKKRSRKSSIIKKNELSPKYLAFCNEYLINNFNGGQAYAVAYEKNYLDNSASCRASASMLLSKPQICDYIMERLEDRELNFNEVLDKLSFNIKQMSDIAASNSAINLYLKLYNKFSPEKIELKTEFVAKFG